MAINMQKNGKNHKINYEESLNYDNILKSRIEQRFKVLCVDTDRKSSQYARADGFLLKNKTIHSIAEYRCRYKYTYEHMKEKFKDCILTWDKVEKNRIVSEILQIPFIFFICIVPSDVFLYWKITNNKGEYIYKPIIDNTLATRKSLSDSTKVTKSNLHLLFTDATAF